jgi:hypothetical protein
VSSGKITLADPRLAITGGNCDLTGARDYERILDLITAIVDCGERHLPWPLAAAELRATIPHAAAVLFCCTTRK